MMGVLSLALASCGTVPEKPATSGETGLDLMERLTLAANRCWFQSDDPAFADYTLAPELSSFSGRPRFLLVPRGRPQARPLLVVEGATGSSEISVYGPLAQADIGPRIERDLERWRAGGESCKTSA